MKTQGILSILILASLVLTGCQTDSKDSSAPFDSYSVVENISLQTADEQISGWGRVGFLAPLAGINGRNHFRLTFQLPTKKSRITLYVHISNSLFNDGLALEFSRADSHLAIKVSAIGQSEIELGSFFNNFNFKEKIPIRVEIHDGLTEGDRILIWGPRPGSLSAEHAFFDSLEAGLKFRFSGQGASWGLMLENAIVWRAERELPYVD